MELDAEIEAILDKTKPAETTAPEGSILNIYEGVDKDGNKRQVEVMTTKEGIIEARLILENGEIDEEDDQYILREPEVSYKVVFGLENSF